jgi:hypothetical protein
MRFDVYGRFLLEIDPTPDGYRVYELGPEGKRRRRGDIVLPPDLPERDVARFLDDQLHELGAPGRGIRRIQSRQGGQP